MRLPVMWRVAARGSLPPVGNLPPAGVEGRINHPADVRRDAAA